MSFIDWFYDRPLPEVLLLASITVSIFTIILVGAPSYFYWNSERLHEASLACDSIGYKLEVGWFHNPICVLDNPPQYDSKTVYVKDNKIYIAPNGGK